MRLVTDRKSRGLLTITTAEYKGVFIPHHVILTIDVSGSMVSASKQVKKFALAVAAMLCEQVGNCLEIIIFSDTARSLLTPFTVTDLNQITWFQTVAKVVDTLVMKGATNTHAAVLKTLKAVSGAQGKDTLCLFLTDGNPTTGELSTSTKIYDHVHHHKTYPKYGWQLITVGLGHLLQATLAALVGRGMLPGSAFNTISSVDEIPTIIGHALGDPILARHVALKFTGNIMPAGITLPVLQYGQTLHYALDVAGPGGVGGCALVLDHKQTLAVGTSTAGWDDWVWVRTRVMAALQDFRMTGDRKTFEQATKLLTGYVCPDLRRTVTAALDAKNPHQVFRLAQNASGLFLTRSSTSEQSATQCQSQYDTFDLDDLMAELAPAINKNIYNK